MVKTLANPIVLKTLLVIGAIILVAIMLMAAVSGIASLFSSFTLSSNDKELSKTYAYITELDNDLNYRIQNIQDELAYIFVEQYEFYLNGVQVSQEQMELITNADYFLNYLDVKYKDYTLDGTLLLFGIKVRDEVTNIHSGLYTLTETKWDEEIEHSGTYFDGYGNEVPYSWTETIKHLSVSLTTKSIEQYIEENKATLFESDQEEQYDTLNQIGGMNLRQELGNPFEGIDWRTLLSCRYGWRIHPIEGYKDNHSAIDIATPEGTPLLAVLGGTVTTGYDASGYGNYITVTSGNRSVLYAHCSLLNAVDGQTVERGDIIAYVGNTGNSTGAHVHLEYKKDGDKLNPAFYLSYE